MKTSNNVAVVTNSEMSANIALNLDEMVAIFMARYENNLYEDKARLTKDLNASNAAVGKARDAIIDEYPDKDDYKQEETAALFGDSFLARQKCAGIRHNLAEGTYDVTLEISMTLQHADKDDEDHISRHFNENRRVVYSKAVKVPIKKPLLKTLEKAEKVSEKLREQLTAVIDDISNIARKERQVRGKISEVKLADSAFADLLQNKELLQLVNDA